MTQDEILTELRTIRALLALDKEDRLRELTPELSDIQYSIIDELDYSEWNALPTSDIANNHDTHANTVRNHRDELLENNMIIHSGSGSGTKYRKTGQFRSAQELGLIDTE